MITEVIKMLWDGDHFNVSEDVEHAKGKLAYPQTYKQAWQQFKRALKWKK